MLTTTWSQRHSRASFTRFIIKMADFLLSFFSLFLCVFLPQVMKISSSCSLVRLSSTSTLTTSQPSPSASCFDWWKDKEREREVTQRKAVVMETVKVYFYYCTERKGARGECQWAERAFPRAQLFQNRDKVDVFTSSVSLLHILSSNENSVFTFRHHLSNKPTTDSFVCSQLCIQSWETFSCEITYSWKHMCNTIQTSTTWFVMCVALEFSLTSRLPEARLDQCLVHCLQYRLLQPISVSLHHTVQLTSI